MFQDNIGNIVGIHIVLVDSSTHIWWLAAPAFLYRPLHFEAQGSSQPQLNSCFFLSWRALGPVSLQDSDSWTSWIYFFLTNMQKFLVSTLGNIKCFFIIGPLKPITYFEQDINF